MRRISNIAKELENIKYALDVSAIVAITDIRGNIIYANDTFCHISKYSRQELIGQNHKILNSGFHDKEFFRHLWRTIANGQVWKGEIRNKAKDGSLYWVDTTIVPLLNERRKPYQYVSIRYEVTKRREMEEEIKGLPRRILQAQEAESNRIARDIHDDLGQSLVTLKMLMQSAWMTLKKNKPVQSSDQIRMTRYLDLIIEKSRHLSSRLHPSTLQMLGLPTAVRNIARDLSKAYGVDIAVTMSVIDGVFFQAENINVYRIIQEGLTNAVKHAKAKRITLSIAKRKNQLTIIIKDNGKGFDIAKVSKGLGLITMNERAQLLGATLSFQSTIKKGTVLTVHVPIQERVL